MKRKLETAEKQKKVFLDSRLVFDIKISRLSMFTLCLKMHIRTTGIPPIVHFLLLYAAG